VDITTWLRDLGLERYAASFRDNDIDAGVLPNLTAEDLIAVGVASVGHRRKLLAAIAALNSKTAAAAEETPPAAAPAINKVIAEPSQYIAERRQLTVMFCDLVGSTELAARLDPEDLRDVIGAYNRCVADAIGRYDGFVAKYMGDGVLAYFGYPQAHEDDAERAVRAALDIIAAVGRLDLKSVKLQARLGIASGLVVVGDLIGEGSAQEQSVVGETPNLAARMQTLAEPDALVIDSCKRLLTARCSAAPASYCTHGLPQPSKSISPTAPAASPRHWLGTFPRRCNRNARGAAGLKPENELQNAPPIWKLLDIYRRRS
jgi:class 3 adenylate cyclase